MNKISFIDKLIKKLKPKKKEPLEPPQLTPIEEKEKIKSLRPLEPDPKIKPVQPKPTPVKK